MNFIEVFTDGGARGNGKEDSLGAWAFTASIEVDGEKHYIERNGITKGATNNMMEIQACIEALKAMKNPNVPVRIHSDSAYVINTINPHNGWINNWVKNGWKKGKKKNEEILNLELWQELYTLRNKFNVLEWKKVAGHSDNEGNNIADRLVNEAMDEFLRSEEE